MRHSDLNEILVLVDKLTMPHIVEHQIEQDNKLIRSKVQHDALLDQLDELIASSSGTAPGGGALSSERNVLNTEALELRDALAQQIRQLYMDLTSSRPFPTSKQNLRQWFIEFRLQDSLGKVSPQRMNAAFKKVNSIVQRINAKLDPPTVIEITAPCPRCSADFGFDEQGVYRRAVIVESRVYAERSLDNTRAKCVGCGAVWVHGNGMRQLRYEIDLVEEGRDTPESVELLFDPSSTLDSAVIQARPNEEAS